MRDDTGFNVDARSCASRVFARENAPDCLRIVLVQANSFIQTNAEAGFQFVGGPRLRQIKRLFTGSLAAAATNLNVMLRARSSRMLRVSRSTATCWLRAQPRLAPLVRGRCRNVQGCGRRYRPGYQGPAGGWSNDTAGHCRWTERTRHPHRAGIRRLVADASDARAPTPTIIRISLPPLGTMPTSNIEGYTPCNELGTKVPPFLWDKSSTAAAISYVTLTVISPTSGFGLRDRLRYSSPPAGLVGRS
jgi:hypothetical protein